MERPIDRLNRNYQSSLKAGGGGGDETKSYGH